MTSLKKSLSLFHAVVNTATLFVTLVKFPKAWLHMSTIIPLINYWLLLLQFKLDAFRGHCQPLFMSGSLSFFPVWMWSSNIWLIIWARSHQHRQNWFVTSRCALKMSWACWDEWPSHSTTTSLLKWIMNNPTGKLTPVDREDGLSAFFFRSPWSCVDLILLGIQHLHHFADHSYHYWCCCGRATVKEEA